MVDEANDNGGSMPWKRGSVPVPDPTVLTTQQLYREIAMMRELLEAKAGCQADALARHENEAQRRFIEIGQINTKFSELTLREVQQLKQLHDERFATVGMRFDERDKRFEQIDKANKDAIAAALVGAKELTNVQNIANNQAFEKSQVNFSKQIDQISEILRTITRSTEDKIGDLKTRLDTIEAKKAGSSENWSGLISVAGLIISIGALLVLAFTHVAPIAH